MIRTLFRLFRNRRSGLENRGTVARLKLQNGRLELEQLEPREVPAAIRITEIPPYGVDGFIRGQVTGVNPALYRVAPYIQMEGAGWWTKPTFDDRTVPINSDGTFVADVATGGIDNRATIFAAALIPAGVTPPCAGADPCPHGTGRIPADLNPIAIDFFERYSRTIQFAGRSWGVKESPAPFVVGPGANRFSNHPSDVFVDGNGRLHLTLNQRDGIWWATELILLDRLGHGTYSFQTDSRLDILDRNVTFGGFTWDPYGDEESGADAHREIDFEDSRWGRMDPPNAQMVVQPFGVTGNLYPYTIPDLSGDPALTRFFRWEHDRIQFVALRGHHSPSSFPPASVIDQFLYLPNPSLNHYVPTEGRESFRFNLWLNRGATAPFNGQPVEVVISDFTFTPAPLQVTSFTPTSTGFRVQFNRRIDASMLNLYDTQSGGLGVADVTLTSSTAGLIRGSLVFNSSSTGFTFIQTGGPLAPGTYTVTLRSAMNGFKVPDADVLLDGNGDGTGGDNYTNTFTVASSSAVVVSVPDLARGPLQMVELPLRLSASGGITSVNLTIRYDPRLLTITSATASGGLPMGASAMLNPASTPGTAIINFTSPALPSGITDFVRLTAMVPATAGVRYTQKHLLDIDQTSLSINGGAIVSLDNDGLHVNSYLGDASGNGTYTSTDATRVLRVAVGLDSGFLAYQLADPVILADISGNGTVNATDATRILQEAVGIDRPEIPALPAPPPLIMMGGPDPLLSLPKRSRARPGSVLVVPVNLDPSDGLESADLALAFDPGLLEVVSVRRGRLTGDFDLFAVNLDAEAGTLRVGLGRSAGPILGRGNGSVLLITFRIKPDATAGRTIINLRQEVGTTFTQLNEGGLDLIPDPNNEAGDALDGEITIRGRAVRQRLARDLVFTAGPRLDEANDIVRTLQRPARRN